MTMAQHQHHAAQPQFPRGGAERSPKRFDRIEVLADSRQVVVDGRATVIGARAFDVLLVLLERRNRLVTKAELFDAVWPEQVVVENNLAVQIGTLRRILGPETILTVPGRGYRFLPAGAREAGPADPAPRAVAGVAQDSTLPAPLYDRLIGRDVDRARLSRLLTQHRLVTVAGPGGVGKSHLVRDLLADRVAARTAAWIDLSAVIDAGELISAVARSLGVPVTGGGHPVSMLAQALAPLELLVVLDNAEHLLDAAADLLAQALASAPGVAFVVTSQSAMQVAQEQVLRLAPLGLPDEDATLAEAAAAPAVQLFVQRARSLASEFALDAASLSSVVRITRELDGLPLALELAAARVQLLGITGVEAALGERLRLLGDGRRRVPQRQRTLRAALEWSHGLLTEPERILMRRLAVFSGSFALEAAQRVAADDAGPLDGWAALDLLGSLIDRSMVVVLDCDPPRYRLLTSTRALAREHLAAAGEQEMMRGRQAHAMLQCIGGAFDQRFTLGHSLDSIEAMLLPELDDANCAVRWAISNDPALAVTLSVNYWAAFSSKLSLVEVMKMWAQTRPFLDAPGVAPLHRAKWLIGAALTRTRTEPGAAGDDARQAMALLADQPHRRWDRCYALYALASARVRIDATREPEEARELLARCTADAPPLVHYYAALLQANRRHAGGAPQEALAHYQRAHEAAREAGAMLQQTTVAVALADLMLLLGRVPDAISQGRELLQGLERQRRQWMVAYVLLNLFAALVVDGEFDEARLHARRLLPMAFGHFDHRAALSNHLAMLAVACDQPDAAAFMLGFGDRLYARSSGQRQGNEAAAALRAEAEARQALGTAAFESARLSGAQCPDEAALALARRLVAAG